jgi:hypothetical protein
MGTNTVQRGGDAVYMKRSDIADGILRLTQQKTGTKLLIPIHPAFARSKLRHPRAFLFWVTQPVVLFNEL